MKTAALQIPIPAQITLVDSKGKFGTCEKNLQNELINPLPPRKRGRRCWTPEQRADAAQRARKNKPWRHSTGPKTAAGKARSRLNSYKHGLHSVACRELKWVLREQSRYVATINVWIKTRRAANALGLPDPAFAFTFRPFQANFPCISAAKPLIVPPLKVVGGSRRRSPCRGPHHIPRLTTI